MKNVLLFGRKKWSMYAMQHLLEEDFNVVGVIGKPASEELDGTQGSLLSFANEKNIPIYKYSEVYDLVDIDKQTFDGHKIDYIISYLFWGKLKSLILDIAKVSSINFHPGPLPDYQGLGGYNAAILDGREKYGVTAHIMSEKIDAGNIIKVNKFEIESIETAFSLEQKSMTYLLELFKEVFSDNLEEFINNNYPNNIHKGRYIDREEFENMKLINENDSEDIIEKKIRAFWYPPYEGAKFKVGNKYYTLIDESLLVDIADKYHK